MKTGKDVRIHETVIISQPDLVTIGNHVSIDPWTYISTKLTIHNWVHISPHVAIIGGATAALTMEDHTNLSVGTKVICASDDFTQGLISPSPLKYRSVINSPVVFKSFANTGVNCVIFPGVVLAEGTALGANTVVTKNTEPWTVYVGCPARPVKTRDKNGIIELAKKLDDESNN